MNALEQEFFKNLIRRQISLRTKNDWEAYMAHIREIDIYDVVKVTYSRNGKGELIVNVQFDDVDDSIYSITMHEVLI